MAVRTGFTLIELLVVVLIIGILAAIALPQYRITVMKSRLATLMTNVRAIKDSAEMYYLVNGKYPSDDIHELDIDIAACTKLTGGSMFCPDTNTSYNYNGNAPSNPGQRYDVIGYWPPYTDDSWQISYTMVLDRAQKDNGKIYCSARPANETAEKVCQSMGGKPAGTNIWEL